MRALLRLFVLTLGFGILASHSASAGLSIPFYLDDNGFSSPLAPFPPIVGTGNLTISTNLADGTYTFASLPSYTLSFSLINGDSFTQADIVSDQTQSEVVIYNNGQNAYFTDITPDAYSGGSITFINYSNFTELAFSPSYILGVYIEANLDTGLQFEGNYGNAVYGSPEPSTIATATVGALAGIFVLARRRKAISA